MTAWSACRANRLSSSWALDISTTPAARAAFGTADVSTPPSTVRGIGPPTATMRRPDGTDLTSSWTHATLCANDGRPKDDWQPTGGQSLHSRASNPPHRGDLVPQLSHMHMHTPCTPCTLCHRLGHPPRLRLGVQQHSLSWLLSLKAEGAPTTVSFHTSLPPHLTIAATSKNTDTVSVLIGLMRRWHQPDLVAQVAHKG